MSNFISYECAVYTHDVEALTDALVALIRERMAEFPQGHARAAVIAAALATTANLMDGALFDPLGVTGKLATVCTAWPRE